MWAAISRFAGFARRNSQVRLIFAVLLAGAGILLWLYFFGHHSVWAPKYYSQDGIALYGSVSSSMVARIDALLAVLPPPVRNSIDSVNINDEPSHYGKNNIGHFYCICWHRRICLQNRHIENALWHEAAHAYATYLNQRKSGFRKEWIKAAGNVYGKDNAGTVFPRDGLLNSYSATNYSEDVGEYFQEFYRAVTGRETLFRNIYVISLQDFAEGKPWRLDRRYRQKVNLLLKYGFVSRADYDKFMDLGYLDVQSGIPLAYQGGFLNRAGSCGYGCCFSRVQCAL